MLRHDAEQAPRVVRDVRAHASPARAPSRECRLLFITSTTFLPQLRMRSRNARSVSVNGRSADVTNSTRSARGTYAARDRLVLADDGVRARRVDDQNVFVAHGRHRGRRRRRPFLHQPAARQRVDEGALPRVEFADDDQQKQFIQLLDRPTAAVRQALVAHAEADERARRSLRMSPLVAEDSCSAGVRIACSDTAPMRLQNASPGCLSAGWL